MSVTLSWAEQITGEVLELRSDNEKLQGLLELRERQLTDCTRAMREVSGKVREIACSDVLRPPWAIQQPLVVLADKLDAARAGKLDDSRRRRGERRLRNQTKREGATEMSDEQNFDRTTPSTWDGAGYRTQAEVDAHNRGIKIGVDAGREGAVREMLASHGHQPRLERYVLALAGGAYEHEQFSLGAEWAREVVADARVLMAAVDAEVAK